MSKKIRIGVLGCASIARRLVLPNMLNSGLYEITAIASRKALKAREFAEAFSCEPVVGYENLIQRTDIDAVYIPLPTGLHYEWLLKSLNAGKHAFVEKSITSEYEETRKVIETAKSKNLCVFENFMFPYHSQFQFVNKLIADDEIGDIKLLRSAFGFPVFDTEDNIRYKKQLGGGALLDAGAYTILAAQLLLGTQQTVLASSLRNEGSEVDFQGSVMLENANGVVSQLAFGFDNFYQNNIELWGSKGKMTVERAFTAGPGFNPRVIVEKQGSSLPYILDADNHFLKILSKFHASIESGDYGFQFEQIVNQSKIISEVRNKAKF